MVNILGYNSYITSEGDTFDILSLKYYNEEKMSSVIINENPDYSDVLIFEQGVSLKIPIIDKTEAPETLPPWRRDE